MEAHLQKIVKYIYQRLAWRKHLCLVRIQTHPYGELEESSPQSSAPLDEQQFPAADLKCWTLLAQQAQNPVEFSAHAAENPAIPS
jgi:hypothetical protein